MNRRTLLQSIIGAAVAPEIPVTKIKPLRVIGTGAPYYSAKDHGAVKFIQHIRTKKLINGQWIVTSMERVTPEPSYSSSPLFS